MKVKWVDVLHYVNKCLINFDIRAKIFTEWLKQESNKMKNTIFQN
jgi:hypothetical protein